jgi:hypothetical protein
LQLQNKMEEIAPIDYINVKNSWKVAVGVESWNGM